MILPLRRYVESNLAAANPLAALPEIRDAATEIDVDELPIAARTSDDVPDRIGETDAVIWETGQSVAVLADRLVAANARLGIDAVLPALEASAWALLGGRSADPSLCLSPMVRLGSVRLGPPGSRDLCGRPPQVRCAGHRQLLRRPSGGGSR